MHSVRVFILFLGLQLAACTPSPNSEKQQENSEAGGNNIPAQSSVESWSAEMDCGGCHVPQAKSLENPHSLGYIHHQVGANCTNCHTNEAMLKIVHEEMPVTATLPEQLLLTKVDRKVCLGCHVSYEALADRTKDFNGLVDIEGNVVNPHAIPKNQNHARVVCASCHKMHQHSAAEDALENAMYTCQSCHHAKVFKCSGCH